MTDNNCYTCGKLRYRWIPDLTTGETDQLFYCKSDNNNINSWADIEDRKIDDLDAPCKFHKPIEDKGIYTTF